MMMLLLWLLLLLCESRFLASWPSPSSQQYVWSSSSPGRGKRIVSEYHVKERARMRRPIMYFFLLHLSIIASTCIARSIPKRLRVPTTCKHRQRSGPTVRPVRSAGQVRRSGSTVRSAGPVCFAKRTGTYSVKNTWASHIRRPSKSKKKPPRDDGHQESCFSSSSSPARSSLGGHQWNSDRHGFRQAATSPCIYKK